MATIFLELDLARRIELAEARAAVQSMETMRRLQPGSVAAMEEIAGGYAVYCGANSPVTQAVGLGLTGPVSDEDFARLEDFYRTRREAVRVECCPLADPTLFQHFGEKGYTAAEFSSVLVRSLDDPGDSSTSSEIAIEKVPAEEIELWTLTVAQGFAEHFPVTAEMLNVMKMFALGPAAECYLARIQGAVAGGATLAIRDGIAGLFGASTLPQFRRRGVQSALLQTRLRRAVNAGCDIAASLTQPGSASERNMIRAGFRVLYTRVKFEKPCAE